MRVIITIVVLGLAAAVVLQSMRVSKLGTQNGALQQQLAAAQAQIESLEQRRPQAGLTPSSDEAQTELLRLRNQAAQLKQATNELQKLRAQAQQLQATQQARSAEVPPAVPPAPAGASAPVPRESWAFAGYATPEAALQSAIFSMSQGDVQTFIASLSPEEAQRVQKSFETKTPEQVAQEGQREMAKVKSFQVLGREELGPDRVVLQVYATGEERVQRVIMQKIGEEWKWAGGISRRQQQQQPPQ
jgi:hypothetical protein